MRRVGITGHQSIPPAALPYIEEGIMSVLADGDVPLTGVSALAAGADQLFARAVLEKHGRLHVVIPCDEYEETFTDATALDSYRDLLARAASVERLQHRAAKQEAFLDAGRRVAELVDVLIAVWDGEQARGTGGTGDIVNYARDRQCRVVVVWPAGILR